MTALKVGYWVAQEQYDPQTLIQFSHEAEVVGFDMIISSDHFHPWRDSSGHSGFPWIWLACAGAKLKVSELGTAVTTPCYRYHPAIVAQAFATLDNLYPGRISLTVGVGHKINEYPLGFEWPGYTEKVERLREAIEIIQALWKGDFVNYNGKYYKLRNAKLYTTPKEKVPIYIATSNKTVAAMAGRLADGICTNPRGLDNHLILIKEMNKAAEDTGRDFSKFSTSLEFKVAYDIDYDKAVKSAMYWAPTAIPRKKRENISDPKQLEESVGPEEIEKVKNSWLITTDSDPIIKRLGEFLEMGFNRIYIHSASPNERKFLRMLGRDILPWMREYYENVKSPISSALD